MRSRTALLVGLAVVLVLPACGDDDEARGGDEVTSDEQPYVDSLVESFTSGDEDDLQLSEEQAECVAPLWMDTIGMDRIQEARLAPDDIGAQGEGELAELGLSEAEGAELYDAFGDCGVDFVQVFVEGLGASGDLPLHTVACLGEQFDDDVLRRIMVTTITQGEEALEDSAELTDLLMTAFRACPGAIQD